MDMSGVWENWSDDESRLFDQALGEIAEEFGERISDSITEDDWVGFLYHEAMWDWELSGEQRGIAYNAFVDYMMEEFGIEWEDVYDWDAYREAYDNAA